MTRFAQLFISGNFASGVTCYEDRYSNQEQSTRIVLTVTVERYLTVRAIVDTGAPWCILAPEIVERLGITPRTSYALDERLTIRGISYEGKLLRMKIGLRAEQEGEDCEIEATVFVPTLSPDSVWPYPNFIGLNGFLNRIRFAVDPCENAFYFGLI